MRQIFSSVKLRTYTSRAGLPGCARENAGITPSSPTNGRRAGGPSPVAGSSPQTSAAGNRARSKRGSLCHSRSHAALSGLQTRDRRRAWPHRRRSCRFAVEARAAPRRPTSSCEGTSSDSPSGETDGSGIGENRRLRCRQLSLVACVQRDREQRIRLSFADRSL